MSITSLSINYLLSLFRTTNINSKVFPKKYYKHSWFLLWESEFIKDPWELKDRCWGSIYWPSWMGFSQMQKGGNKTWEINARHDCLVLLWSHFTYLNNLCLTEVLYSVTFTTVAGQILHEVLVILLPWVTGSLTPVAFRLHTLHWDPLSFWMKQEQ